MAGDLIGSIGTIGTIGGISSGGPTKVSPPGGSFQKALSEALQQVNDLRKDADNASAQLASGEPVDLHDVLIANEQASLAFQLTVQVRNKLMDAYQEVMRMPV